MTLSPVRGVMGALFTSLPFLWILAGALAVLALFGFCHTPAQSAIPPKVQHELDSLRSTKARDAHVIDSLKGVNGLNVSRATEHTVKSTSARQGADRAQARADELALTARQAQTADARAAEWKAAYDARTEESDSLRHALAYSDSASAEREAARQALQSALALSELRRNKAEQLNEDLAKTIQQQARGCRILALIRCPTRKETLVGGTIIGAAIKTYLDSRKKGGA
jgi:cytoskeletal protein RodZ